MTATALFVSFRTPALDLDWIPETADVVVVHNDRSLDPQSCRPSVRHLFSDVNVGFGAAVNLALPEIRTERVVICNPDAALTPAHWAALAAAGPDEVATTALVDGTGRPTSTVNRYPTWMSLLLTGYRIGRLFPRGGRARHRLARVLPGWGRDHASLLTARSGSWPLACFWGSGAVMSVAVERLRQVGGFEPSYFLYLEDIDVCRRLARRFPSMRVTLVGGAAGVHTVRGSSSGRAGSLSADLHALRSARRYARSQTGPGWRLSDLALAPRGWWLAWRSP